MNVRFCWCCEPFPLFPLQDSPAPHPTSRMPQGHSLVQSPRQAANHGWSGRPSACPPAVHPTSLAGPRRGMLWTACGQRCVDSKNSQTTPATTSTSSIRQLLGAADTQTAHHVTFSTVPTHQRLGSANAETTPAGAPAAAANRKQRPDATCEGKTG